MSDFNVKPSAYAVLAGTVLLTLSACDSTSQQPVDTLAVNETGVAIALPQRIREIGALDVNDITAMATVNGVEVPLSRSGDGSYRGQIQVAARSTFPVIIEFSENFTGNTLVLASNTQQVTTSNSNAVVNLRRSDYDYDSHDSDNDSVSNIVEREEDTDPLDGTDSPEMINVTVVAQRPALLAGSAFNRFFLEGTVGNSVKRLVASGNEFRGEFRVPKREPLSATVNLIETVTGDEVSVSDQSQQLATLTDQQTVTFNSGEYSGGDRDGDGRSDLAELLAGTDIYTPGNPGVNDANYSVSFSVPPAIVNAADVYAELTANGAGIGLIRNANDFTASVTAQVGDSVVLKSDFLHTYNNQPYVIATAEKTVQIGSDGQSVLFADAEYQLDIDTDNDGIANYLERQQGTNPFAGPDTPAVSCTVSDVPGQALLAGQVGTIDNISGFIDCGDNAYVLAAAEYNFNWSAAGDQIQWTVPASAATGSAITLSVAVQNPADSGDVYATLPVVTQVQLPECPITTQEFSYLPTKDVYRTDTRVRNDALLRVETGVRQALIGYVVDDIDAELVAAQLDVTVAADGGNGTVTVYQDTSLVWSETDNTIALPPLGAAAGELNNLWSPNQSYTIPLTNLSDVSQEFTLLLLQTTGTNDVSFVSNVVSTGPELKLTYSGCFEP